MELNGRVLAREDGHRVVCRDNRTALALIYQLIGDAPATPAGHDDTDTPQ
jgi:hypothetical protein